ncbi:hypothetical protein Hbl1158_02925 [Halobaculum sp. CBA1158]|uniref:hypothetical protein n=1 Tax=Halobaculum sp. CBA1158 TaxID=2904243 RepID=UPI001F3E1B69|nr:hypothetical protein [Halobaculum sp. CBA1158]UIP00340.1 hypothetical protein Hbl1158_02925 [Halobaculum sp. CBA1158]
MQTLRFTGPAGRFRLPAEDVDVANGETVDIDDETAEYLLANGNFEVVESADSADETEADESDSVDPPLDPANYTVSELETALEDGEYSDDELAAIRAAESAGKNRTGVRGALDTRLEE